MINESPTCVIFGCAMWGHSGLANKGVLFKALLCNSNLRSELLVILLALYFSNMVSLNIEKLNSESLKPA